MLIGSELTVNDKERDLRIKVNAVLGFIRSRTENKTLNFTMLLYKYMMHTQLEDCVKFWLLPK